MIRPRLWMLAIVLGIALFTAAPSFADTFDFTVTGVGISASGQFVTNPQSGGTFLITDLTGTQNGQTLTLIGVNGFAGNDNLLLSGFPALDFAGVSFAAGGVDYNLYFNSYGGFPLFGGALDYYETSTSGVLGTEVQFSVTPAPEPSSVLLLAAGLACLAFLLRRTA